MDTLLIFLMHLNIEFIIYRHIFFKNLSKRDIFYIGMKMTRIMLILLLMSR